MIQKLQKLKYITLGIIIGATTIATPSIASEIKEYVLYKADYKLLVNNHAYENSDLPVLNWKGNSYVPLKAVGELLDADVTWNPIGQVEIGKKVVVSVDKDNQSINTSEPKKQNEKPANQFILGVQQSKEISKYLEDNFSTLKTAVGDTKFSFSTIKNVGDPKKEYDFLISAKFDVEFFDSIKSYPKEIQNTVKTELKNHQEQIAKAIINRHPNIKFMGRYYHIAPSQPMLKIQSVTKRYFTWTNFKVEQDPSLRHYANEKAGELLWRTADDTEF